MKSNPSKVLTLSAMTLAVALTSGCKFTGGGSMLSASQIEGEKATVAMNGKCDNDLMTLNMQYNEHGSGLVQVRFHIDSEFPVDCEGAGFPTGVFVGEYCPQPYGQWKNEPNAGCGVAEIVVEDGNIPNGYFNIGEDVVGVALYDGAFDGYFNINILQGNITSH